MKRLLYLAALVVVATLAFAPAALADQHMVDLSCDTVPPDPSENCDEGGDTAQQPTTTQQQPVYRDQYGQYVLDHYLHPSNPFDPNTFFYNIQNSLAVHTINTAAAGIGTPIVCAVGNDRQCYSATQETTKRVNNLKDAAIKTTLDYLLSLNTE